MEAKPQQIEAVVEYAKPQQIEAVVEYAKPQAIEAIIEYAKPQQIEAIVEYAKPQQIEAIVEYAKPAAPVKATKKEAKAASLEQVETNPQKVGMTAAEAEFEKARSQPRRRRARNVVPLDAQEPLMQVETKRAE